MVIFGQLHFNSVQENLKIIFGRENNVLHYIIIQVVTVLSLQRCV